MLLAAVYLAVPNSWEVDANLTNAQWHLALLALVCLLPEPASPAWKVLDVAVVVVSGLTGPFVLVLALVGTWWIWKGPRTAWRVALWATVVGLAVVQGVELLAYPRGPNPLGATPGRLVEILGADVGLGALVGQGRLSEIVTGHHLLLEAAAGGAAFVVVVGWALARAPLALRVFDAYALTVLAASLYTPAISGRRPQWQLLIMDLGGRYWLFPTLAFLSSAAWLGCGSVRTLVARLQSPRVTDDASRRARRRVRTGALVVGSALGLGTIGISGALAMPQDWQYAPYATVGYGKAVAAFERASPGSRVSFPEDPRGWDMVLVRR